MNRTAAAVILPLIAAAIAALAAAALPPIPAVLVAAVPLWIALWLLLAARRPIVARAPLATPVAAGPSVETLAALTAPLPSGVFLLDSDLNVLAMNVAAEELTGRSREQAIGHSLIRGTFDHELLQVARAPGGEPQLITRPGEREVRVRATTVDAPPVALVLVVEDRSALARAVRARTDLIANVSHELRTPVAAAQALAETLRDGVDDAALRERFSGRLLDETERLGVIVARLLYLSRIESGAEVLEYAPLDPAAVIATALGRIAPLAEQRGVTFVATPPAAEMSVFADRDRLLEVLENLFDNALRFSPPGGTVHVAWTREAGPAGEVLSVSIRDEGPGILPTERERVFERFFTSDRSRGPGGGTGLGLSISRHLIEAHGGTIWVAEATPGATLCFTLPLAEPDRVE